MRAGAALTSAGPVSSILQPPVSSILQPLGADALGEHSAMTPMLAEPLAASRGCVDDRSVVLLVPNATPRGKHLAVVEHLRRRAVGQDRPAERLVARELACALSDEIPLTDPPPQLRDLLVEPCLLRRPRAPRLLALAVAHPAKLLPSGQRGELAMQLALAAPAPTQGPP
jgi:hypothetical protein